MPEIWYVAIGHDGQVLGYMKPLDDDITPDGIWFSNFKFSRKTGKLLKGSRNGYRINQCWNYLNADEIDHIEPIFPDSLELQCIETSSQFDLEYQDQEDLVEWCQMVLGMVNDGWKVYPHEYNQKYHVRMHKARYETPSEYTDRTITEPRKLQAQRLARLQELQEQQQQIEEEINSLRTITNNNGE